LKAVGLVLISLRTWAEGICYELVIAPILKGIIKESESKTTYILCTINVVAFLATEIFLHKYYTLHIPSRNFPWS